MGDELRIGRHVFRFEHEDLLLMEIHGDIERGEMAAMYRVHDERLLALGRLFVLADVRQAAGMSRMTKGEGLGRPKSLPPHVVAVVGAPFPVQVVIELFARATKLLTGGATTLRFFETIAEARAYLEECRRSWKPSA
ncbi:STAS/SEC14 domain-containing protein [Polyangium sp. y55x31]|uniref:STAS/SEC14 domain-containing protein n=1 Tax=Polyangium sp. y55x31 TaxID=3042688 RepID=UPI002482F584|nr:STAS/SEC14 domain-containing protein [Polyangium sp. y55x31]MDI1483377.1 STAS/SEC14 domain-containing protein [Polyangium sp. y55x31]